jgi:Flp pilus assembly protein TadD
MQAQPQNARYLYLCHLELGQLAATRYEDFFSRGDCGYHLARAGLMEEALWFVDKAGHLYGPSTLNVQAQKGKVTRLAQRQYAEAASGALNALADFPEDAAMLSLLGAALYGQGKTAEAEGPLRHALKLTGSNSSDHTTPYTLGKICLANNNAQEALDLLTQAHAASPCHVETLGLLGQALCALDRLAEAQRWFEQAVELLPNQPGPLADLARTLMRQKRYAQCRPYFEQVSNLEPHNATFQSNLSHICQFLDDFSAAETHIVKASALAPLDVGIICQHGNLLLALGRHQEALSRFNDALLLDPHSSNAQQGQAQALLHFEQALTTFYTDPAGPPAPQLPAPVTAAADRPFATLPQGAGVTQGPPLPSFGSVAQIPHPGPQYPAPPPPYAG